MSGGTMDAWRRQNSDTNLIEVQLVDGTMLKGTVLVQREKSLKDVFCSAEPFIDFQCSVSGELVLGKAAVASVRPCKQINADQLDRRLKMLEKSDAFGVLKVPKTVDREKVRDAYLTLTRIYHPDRYAGAELPVEVVEYLNSMTRRINAAYSEINILMGPTAANDEGVAA